MKVWHPFVKACSFPWQQRSMLSPTRVRQNSGHPRVAERARGWWSEDQRGDFLVLFRLFSSRRYLCTICIVQKHELEKQIKTRKIEIWVESHGCGGKKRNSNKNPGYVGWSVQLSELKLIFGCELSRGLGENGAMTWPIPDCQKRESSLAWLRIFSRGRF